MRAASDTGRLTLEGPVMLHYEGSRAFPQPAVEVWSKLRDARFLVQCIPGVTVVDRAEPQEAVCTLQPGFAFVRGVLELTLQVVPDPVSPDSTRLLLSSKGIGTTSTVEAVLTLLPQENGTRIQWSADVKELGGLLKAVPRGLVQAAAQKVIADAWTGVETKMNAI